MIVAELVALSDDCLNILNGGETFIFPMDMREQHGLVS
jgi:hypothetical protein